jgi:hypothetical protein
MHWPLGRRGADVRVTVPYLAGGKITGDVRVDGHPKQAATFARVCGYVEQNDIHSPQVRGLLYWD